MNLKSRHYFLSILIPVTVIVGSWALLHDKDEKLFLSSGNPVIELREDGFYPKKITIREGETITFKTTRDIYFWPASNLHPTHTLYPEFDPAEPISPDKKWGFQFDQVGIWEYHDHLTPYFKGTIIVLSADFLDKNAIESCKKEIDFNQKTTPRCWMDLVKDAYKKEGLEAAFDRFIYLYNTEPRFSAYCHDISHTLGEAAYEIFSQKKDLTLTNKTIYCGFGFFHGFMETLVTITGDPLSAREFCSYVKEQVGANAEGACYHGIGHGFAATFEETANGDEWSVVNPTIEFCENIAKTKEQLFRCATGAFDSIAIYYYNNLYGFSINEEDPLWFCREQTAKYKKACYLEMMTALLWFAEYDLLKSIHLAKKHVEKDYLPISIQALADNNTRYIINNPDFENIIYTCQALGENLRASCIQGLANGLMQFGEPENEYVKALTFCGNAMLTEEEKQTCFKRVLDYSQQLYSRKKYSKICESLEDGYKKPCKSFRD
ncbi:hypothetical protein IIA95_03105 [Patescibacteria group bacterium]|nr:hypothetical protein [Patescibacteria group bacterium]